MQGDFNTSIVNGRIIEIPGSVVETATGVIGAAANLLEWKYGKGRGMELFDSCVNVAREEDERPNYDPSCRERKADVFKAINDLLFTCETLADEFHRDSDIDRRIFEDIDKVCGVVMEREMQLRKEIVY